MSHELRTPIAGISGAVQLLKETSVTESQSEILEVVSTSTEQLLTGMTLTHEVSNSQVVNDILEISKLEAKKVDLEEIEVDITEVTENAIEVVSFEAEKKNLELICDVDTSVPPLVLGDKVR